MNSTFTGIEMGKRSLIAHSQALNTVGHNISNASADGYSRQQVEMKAFDPIYMPGMNRAETAGQLGQGVTAERIERVHDEILEGRIVKQGSGQGYWKTREKYMGMVEDVYNEPKETSVRGHMDRFWESWQELSLHPEEMASRRQVIQRGKSLIESIHRRYNQLSDIRDMADQDIRSQVERINSILSDVGKLNKEIVKVEAMGDNPNDLLDERDRLVKELSSMLNITVDGRDPDEFTIHTGGLHLLQGSVAHYLDTEANTQNGGYSDVVWRHNGEQLNPESGSLGSLLELRDGDLREEIQSLDTMTMNFIDMVNENHRDGYGLNGKTGLNFFEEYPAVNNVAGNYDRNGDGELDSSYIFRITGSNSLDSEQQIGLEGTITLNGPQGPVQVNYEPTDTVSEVVERINNSGAEVTARLNRENRLSLKATPAAQEENPDFVMRQVEDTGQFLTGYAGLLSGSGPEGGYQWDQTDAVTALQGGNTDYAVAPLNNPSGWIEVNREVVEEPASIAAGFGENGQPANAGDSSTARAIASLRNSDVMVGKHKNFDEYFSQAVANVGLKGEEAERSLETEREMMKELETMKDSISGVNIDEELSNMIKFQHGYAAASRFVSEVDKMLETIINRMGV